MWKKPQPMQNFADRYSQKKVQVSVKKMLENYWLKITRSFYRYNLHELIKVKLEFNELIQLGWLIDLQFKEIEIVLLLVYVCRYAALAIICLCLWNPIEINSTDFSW